MPAGLNAEAAEFVKKAGSQVPVAPMPKQVYSGGAQRAEQGKAKEAKLRGNSMGFGAKLDVTHRYLVDSSCPLPQVRAGILEVEKKTETEEGERRVVRAPSERAPTHPRCASPCPT